MFSDSFSLVKKDKYYFLIDAYTCNQIAISKSAYDVLYALKSGDTIQHVKECYGEDLVDEILSQLAMLQVERKNSDTPYHTWKNSLKSIEQFLHKEPSILEGVFMIAQDCNLACRYCYGGESGTYNHSGYMTKEMAEKYFRYLLSAGKDRPFQKVAFFGGEPLLNMDVIRHVVSLWEELKPLYNGRKIYFCLTTNGTLLTKEIAEYFKEHSIGITISLDGPKEIHDSNRVFVSGKGSFDKVMENIKMLREMNIPFSTRSTVTKQTNPKKLFSFLEKENFKTSCISPVDYPTVNPEKDYQLDAESFRNFSREYQRVVEEGCRNVLKGQSETFNSKQMSIAFSHVGQYDKQYPFTCGAGWSIVAFGADGNIYPCQRFVGSEKYIIGNVSDGLAREKIVSFFRSFLKASESCSECWAYAICKGRCFMQKATGDGGFKQIDKEICDIYRDSLADNLILAANLQKAEEEGNKDALKKAIIRYDADNMLKEHELSMKR